MALVVNPLQQWFSGVVLYLDRPRWRWRGRLWAHLITDRDLSELHETARDLGLPWLSFGRDHYDIPDTAWPEVAELAAVVDSRELVQRLSESGLRVGGGKPLKHWQPRPALGAEVDSDGSIRDWLAKVRRGIEPAQVEVLHRPDEWVVFHTLSTAGSSVLDLDPVPAGVHVVWSRGRRGGVGIEAVIAPPDRFGAER